MAAQLAGAIGLTCTAPAAYYVGTGRLSERAFVLWAAHWIFAGNRIHFVQLRIHLPVQLRFPRNLIGGGSSSWRSRYVLRLWSSHRYGTALSDRSFCSRAASRNAVVLSTTGILGCKERGLVRDEAWSGIWSCSCRCFGLFVGKARIPGASDNMRRRSIPICAGSVTPTVSNLLRIHK